jgi:hypothetical protein
MPVAEVTQHLVLNVVRPIATNKTRSFNTASNADQPLLVSNLVLKRLLVSPQKSVSNHFKDLMNAVIKKRLNILKSFSNYFPISRVLYTQ